MQRHSLTALLAGLAASLAGAGAIAEAPRMDDGKPDFSGTYDITTLTPWQRNPDLGERKHFTEEEVAEIKNASYGRVEQAAAPLDPDRAALEAPTGEARDRGVDRPGGFAPGSYDYHWFDCGGKQCDLYQIDGQYPSSVIVDPPDGRIPEVSEAGKARRATLLPYYKAKYPGEAWWLEDGTDPYDNPEAQSVGDRCLYMGLTVPSQPVVYNNTKTIVQNDDQVLIVTEWMHWPRIVRLNSEHLPEDMRSFGGDAIGWWEGDTLVVETTNFIDFNAPHPPREGLKVIERFSPIDGDSLLYGFTVHDPDYVAPYSGEFPWHRSDSPMYEYACHEGNYSMANTLSGARALERKWIAEHGTPESAEE